MHTPGHCTIGWDDFQKFSQIFMSVCLFVCLSVIIWVIELLKKLKQIKNDDLEKEMHPMLAHTPHHIRCADKKKKNAYSAVSISIYNAIMITNERKIYQYKHGIRPNLGIHTTFNRYMCFKSLQGQIKYKICVKQTIRI